MGAFDDLIPEPESADSASGAFTDLIPKQESVRGAFSDLIPARKDPTTYETFKDDLNRRAGTFNKAVIGVVPAALRLAGAVEHQLGRPLINRTREEYDADLALWKQTKPEDAALSKAGNFITQKLTQMSPPLDEPDVWDNTVQGAGQLAGMLAGGGAIKLAGATVPVVTAGASTMGGIQEFDDAYLRSRERGDDPDTAFAKSLGYATVSTLIENKLGAGRLLRQIIPDPSLVAKKLTALGVSKTVAGNFIAGGAEEGSQRWAQNLIIEGKPSMEGVMDEAIPGAIVQGLAGAPGGVSQRLESDARYRQEQAFDEAIAGHARKVSLSASMPRGGTGERLAVNRGKDASFEVAGAFDDLIPKSPQSQATKSSDVAAEPDIWADEDQSPQSQAPRSPDVPKTTDSTEQKTSGAVQATSPASGASTPLTISNIQDSTENQTALPPVERMPSDAGFTHSTMARSYFFDGGPGVMISTGYLANAIAGAFPRASSRLWEVFKANEKAITDTLGDIRTLVVTEHWAKLRAEIVTAVESSYGVNTAEARAILDAMLDNPTGVTFRDGARLENRLDALESEQRLAPTPAKTTPSKQSQVRAELMALPGAEQDLDESQLTPEQAAAPATKGDLKQVVEDLRAALQGNQLAPKVDVSSANGGVSGANGKTAQVQPQPAAAMTTGEQSELKTLRQKDADGDLSNEEQQRMRTLWRKETASKRRAATQKYANELKGRGVVIPDGFYNPSEGKENHITDFTVDKNGFIQIRIETHDDASMSSRLVTVKPGDTLSHGMNDTVAGTTRYSESNPLPDQSSSPQGTGTAAGQVNLSTDSPVGEQTASPSPVKPDGRTEGGRLPLNTLADELHALGAGEHTWISKHSPRGAKGSASNNLPFRQDLERLHGKRFTDAEWSTLQQAYEDGRAIDFDSPSPVNVMDLPTQDKPLDVDATMKAIHEQERNDAVRAAQEKQYDAQRKKEQSQGITEADGILHTLTGQGVRLPYFAPGGLVIANYRRLKNKLRGNGILSSDEKQLWNKVREQIPDNFEDQFGVDGYLLKEAYAAAEKAGIASALFVRTDKANLRYDTDVLPKLPRQMSVAELLEEVTRLSNQHLANKGKREKGYEGLTDREIAEVKRGEQLAVDQAKVLEDFGNQDEPKTPTAVEQSARTKQDSEILRRIVSSRPGLRELVGLTVVGDGAGTLRPGRGTESGSGGQAATRRFQSKDAAELERLFGVRIILVRRADGIEFNGYFARGEKTILIDADTQHPLLAVAGHELLHHIKQTHPGLYADLVERLSPMVSEAQLESFRNRLSERGQGGLSNAGVSEELIADFIGDNFLRPEFWNDLAKREPNLFKRLARIVKTWLEKLIAKAKAIRGFESSQHFSDLEQAREVVADVLARVARETQFAAKGVPGQEMAAEEPFSKPPKLTGADVDTTKEMFGAEVRQDKSGQGALFSKERNENPFYSRLTRAVELSQQGKASGAQWKATIRNSKLGSSTDEFALVGVNDFEDGKVYTKQEVLDYIKANEVQVKDVTLRDKKPFPMTNGEHALEMFGRPWGELSESEQDEVLAAPPAVQTHFSTYQLPGAKDGSYREVLLTVPDARLKLPEGYSAKLNAANNPPNNYKWVVSDELGRSPVPSGHGATPQEAIASYHSIHGKNWRDGHSQYSDVVNPVVRLRFNERTTADGKRMLFLEEVQAPQKGQFEKMPALFQKNWREIAFKWALRHAAENGFDSVGWTRGEQQAARYDLSKHIDEVAYHPNPDGTFNFVASRGSDTVMEKRHIPLTEVEANIGKDLAAKMQNGEGTPHTNQNSQTKFLSGVDLKVGGVGLTKLYDVDFRNVVNNLPAVKKAGQKVGMVEINTDDKGFFSVEELREQHESDPSEESPLVTVHSLTITPDILESVMGGQGMFSKPEDHETGIKNAAMEDELADVGKLGLPGFLRTERKSNQTLHDTVTARIADEPGWIDTIIEREKKQPSSLTDEEVFALSHRLVELSSAHSKASRKAAAANDSGDMDTVVESGAQANALSDKIKELADITKESGTIAGRALQARARLFAEDFSLVAMEAKKREANDWAPLTAEQRAEIQKQHDAYEAKIAELEQHLEETTGQLIDEELRRAKAEEEAAALPRYDARVIHHAEQFALAWHKVRLKEEADLMAMLKDSETGGMFSKPSINDRVTKLARYIVEDIVRGVKKAEILEQLKNKFGASVEAKFEAIWAEANIQMERSLSKADKAVPDIAEKIKRVIKRKDAAEREAEARSQIETMIAKGEAGAIFGAVQKMIRSIVEQNRKITREGLIDEVHNTLKEFLPDITRLEAMDAISGRGRFTLPSSDEVSTIVRDLKAQTRLVGHQIDVQAKRPLPRTGFQPGQQSDAVRREAKILEELKRRFGVVVSDPTKQLASVLTARKTYYRNRLVDMAHEIKTRELTVKTKSPEATDAELESLKAEYKALKAEHESIFTKPGLTDAQRLELSEKAADRHIAELERQLRTGEIFAPGKKPVGPTSAALEAKKARIEALKAEREWARDLLQPKPQPLDVEEQRRAAALDKRIEAIESQIANETVFAKGKTPRTDTPENQARLAKLEELKQQRQFIRERLQPKPEIDRVAQALKQRQASLTRQIADYADRLARGDFAKRTRKVLDITQDTKAMALMAQRDAIKKRFEKGVFDDRMARRTRMQKLFYGIRQSKDAMVNIMSSGDLSAPRQLFNYFLDASTRLATSPRAGLEMFKQPLGKMFQAAWSEDKAGAIEQWRLNQPNAKSGAYKIMGIEFSDLHAQSFSKQEEFAHSILDDWAALPFKTGNAAKSVITAPGKAGARMVRVSNRAFISALNVARVMLANELLKANFSHRAPTDAELRAIGNLVNLSTGRGAMNTKVASVTSNVLWSPKLAASRLQVLIGQPLWGKAGREGGGTARKMVLQWYVRQLVAAALLATIVRMFKDDDDDELSSSDAGKVKRGRTRIDPWMGYAQFVVLADRLIESETTSTTTGKTRKLAGGGNLEVIGRFLANKTRPDIVAIVKASAYAFDKARGEEKPRFTGEEVIQSAIPAPLALQEVIAIMRENGMAEGAIIQVLAQFGVGVSVYEDREKQK